MFSLEYQFRTPFLKYQLKLYYRKRTTAFFLIVLVCVWSYFDLFKCSRESKVFLKRILEEPTRIGTIAPSSKYLAACITKAALDAIQNTDEFVVEIGPGTGCITRMLLAKGLPANRLICVELDPELCQYMTANFPTVQTLLGDAIHLETLLAEKKCGTVAAIISGIPLKNLPTAKAQAIIQACCTVLKPQGKLLQFTYGLRPPVTVPGLERKFQSLVFLNLPPAFVWAYSKKS